MGSRLPPYPAYRDSGLGWLPQVPAHWEVRRNGRLFAQRVETGREELPILEVSLRTGVRVRSFGEGGRKQVMADRAKYKRAASGDIAYNMMRLWQGAVGVVPEDGLVSPAYVVAAPYEDVEPRYFAYLFRTADYMREVESFSRGIVADRNRLYWGQFKQMPSPFPPLEEQRRIADYLDAHGRLTNRLIRNRRRLVAALQQRNQAIISAAVSRGLDPSKPMKPTGITTLPEVPSHWDTCLLKRMAMLQRGYDLPEDQRHPGPYPVVSSAGPIGFHSLAKARAPGVVTGRYGSTGKIHFIEQDFWPHNTSLFVVNFFGNLPRFIYYLLQTISTAEHATKAAVPGIDRKDLHETPVAAVPLDEQADIVAYLDAVAFDTRTVIDRTERHIELLRAYRERLIADLVTGERDPREAEIPRSHLPEPVDDGTSDVDDADEGDETDEDDLEAALAEAEE